MKPTKFLKIFKTKKEAPAMPDLSAYTDDILGPSMADPIQELPAKIKMLTRKRKVQSFLNPKATAEEENEETMPSPQKVSGEKTSKKIAMPADEKDEKKLSRREQMDDIGLNPDADQHADKWQNFKHVSVHSIPATIARGVSTILPIAPQFNQVRDLPGYIKTPMVAIEKALFKFLTKTPAGDIQALASVGTKGPNSVEEFHAVAKWISLNGQPDSTYSEKLHQRFTGVKLMNTEGITHLIVDNNSGKFIFSWPSTDNHIK